MEECFKLKPLVEISKNSTFAAKKTAYCQHFSVSYLSSFRPHYQYGEIFNYQDVVDGKTIQVRSEWRNVAEHCLVSGVFADILAEEFALEPSARARVVKAAILHDWSKKGESMELDRARLDGGITLEAFEKMKKNEDEVLRKMGVSEDIIELTGQNTPDSEAGPQTTEGKIIWFVDAMLSGTDVVKIEERFRNQERGWNGKREDPERALRNTYYSNIFRPRFNGRTLYSVQKELAKKISAEFAEKLDFKGKPEDLPFYLKERFVNRVLCYNKDQI